MSSNWGRSITFFVIGAVTLPLLSASIKPSDRGASVTVGTRGELRLDGKPFLPLFVWLQPVSNFDFLKSLGINTLMGEGAGDETARQFLDALKERKLCDISEELQAELKRTNRQLTELSPVILGVNVEGVATVESMEGGPVEFVVKMAEDGTTRHLFLVNGSTSPARVRVSLSGANGLLDLDSGETVPGDAKGVTLTFEPLRARLFVLK